jgi:protein-disulfide isomerase
MHQQRLITFIIFGALSIIILIFFFIWSKPVNLDALLPEAPEVGSQEEPIVTFINPAKGAAEASIILVEYGDFDCEPCKQLHDSLNTVLNTYPNDVRIVWKHMPYDDPDTYSFPASIAAQCAFEQEKFWEFAAGIFENQNAISEDLFSFLVEEYALDDDDFADCYNNQSTLPVILQDYNEGLALGLIGTPTLFINGQQIGTGAISTNEILDYVETLLAE